MLKSCNLSNGDKWTWETSKIKSLCLSWTFAALIAIYLFTAFLPKTLTFELTVKFSWRWIMTSYLLAQTKWIIHFANLQIQDQQLCISLFFQILALETIIGSLQTHLYCVHHYTLHGSLGSFQHFSLPYCPFYWYFTGIKSFWMKQKWWIK